MIAARIDLFMASLGISLYRSVDMCVLKSKILSGVLRVEKCGRGGGRGTHTLCIPSIVSLFPSLADKSGLVHDSQLIRLAGLRFVRSIVCWRGMSKEDAVGFCMLHWPYLTTYLDRQVILWQQHCEIDT